MPDGCSSPFHRHPISIMVSTISAQRLSSPRSSLVAVIPIFTNHTMHSPASALSSCGDGHHNHDEQTTISRSFPFILSPQSSPMSTQCGLVMASRHPLLHRAWYRRHALTPSLFITLHSPSQSSQLFGDSDSRWSRSLPNGHAVIIETEREK